MYLYVVFSQRLERERESGGGGRGYRVVVVVNNGQLKTNKKYTARTVSPIATPPPPKNQGQEQRIRSHMHTVRQHTPHSQNTQTTHTHRRHTLKQNGCHDLQERERNDGFCVSFCFFWGVPAKNKRAQTERAQTETGFRQNTRTHKKMRDAAHNTFIYYYFYYHLHAKKDCVGRMFNIIYCLLPSSSIKIAGGRFSFSFLQ